MRLWVWGLLAVGLALPIGIGYVVARRTVGANVARQRTLILLITLPVAALFGVALVILPDRWAVNGFSLFGFAYLAFVLCYAWFMWQQRRKAGRVLLDLGYTTPGRRWLLSITVMVIAVTMALAIDNVINERLSFQNVGQFAFNTAISGFNLILVTTRNQICERGLLIGGTLLRWEKLRGYEWQRDRPSALRVYGPRGWTFFGGSALPVPQEHRARVVELLEQYTGANVERSAA